VHRLDKATSGCLLMAKKRSWLRMLHELMREGKIYKSYQALVYGSWPKALHLIDKPLKKQVLCSGERLVKVTEDGQTALTQVEISEQFKQATLLDIKLLTGRTHQIRVHMQYLGFPLVGDSLYGQTPTKTRSLLRKSGYDEAVQDAVLNFPRQALHARKIGFVHPRSGDEMEFTAELPQDLEGVISLLKQ
jgi:23S rRNA pseudouridine955/2504/2580 synthase